MTTLSPTTCSPLPSPKLMFPSPHQLTRCTDGLPLSPKLLKEPSSRALARAKLWGPTLGNILKSDSPDSSPATASVVKPIPVAEPIKHISESMTPRTQPPANEIRNADNSWKKSSISTSREPPLMKGITAKNTSTPIPSTTTDQPRKETSKQHGAEDRLNNLRTKRDYIKNWLQNTPTVFFIRDDERI